MLSLLIGRYDLSLKDIFNILIGQNATDIQKGVFLNIRLPRTIFVLIAGCALSLSGFIYQAIFRNPLASGDILGVSSGAAVGAIIGILFFNSSPWAIQILAFVFGIIVVLIAICLTKFMKGSKLYNLVISGIILGALCNGVIMYLKYIADPQRQLASIDYWLMGSFHSVVWLDVISMCCIVIPALVILLILHKQISILTLSDDEATSLGVNVKYMRFFIIILSTLIICCIVSIVGIISWIGLIVPHLARVFFKGSFKQTLIYSILMGGIILLAADLVCKSISQTEVPISVLTSVLGALALIVFMIKRRIVCQLKSVI